MGTIRWGTRGTWPLTSSGEGDIILHVPPLFLFRFYICRSSKNKSDVMTFATFCVKCFCCQIFFSCQMLYIAKLMMKQSLVWYHCILLVINFSFNKMIFTIFQVSRDHKRWLTASVRHSTQCCHCGVLLERLFSWNSESFTGAHVRDCSTAWIWFTWRCNLFFFCNIGFHVFRNKQRKI